MHYEEETEHIEPVTVECDVTVTLYIRAKLKVDDVKVTIDDYGEGQWNKEMDFSEVNWQEVLEDNDLIPEGYEVTNVEVDPIL